MEMKAIYEAPAAETIYLCHECAVMQTSSYKKDYGDWITNEWGD